MRCQNCNGLTKKFGKDRKGQQRYRCLVCTVTFIEAKPRPLGKMILAEEKAIAVIHHLAEGCSIRSTERLTGVNRDTILDLLTVMGEKCERLMEEKIKGLHVTEVQCDEIWDFVGMKQATKHENDIVDPLLGDAWTFTALEKNSKLLLAWHLGHRTESDTLQFTEKLARATEGSFQVTTDGFRAYQNAIVMSLGAQHVDFAQLVKMYAANPENERRYSPAECIGCTKVKVFGNPDMDKVSTSHVERHNLNIRMEMRRFTRLTNAFSKKWVKLHASLALYFAYYNFCRVHRSLRVTPAMEAGITDHIWTIAELVAS